MRVIDLRSDTVTLPTPEMREAMAKAELGDDVFGEDPTVNKLEAMAAETLGKEAAVLTVSGTMSNLVAGLTHCQRGTEMLTGTEAHIFLNEAGSVSVLGGVQVRQVPNDEWGRMDPVAIEAAIRAPGNIHLPITALICLENTHNRCHGSVLMPDYMASVREVADRHHLPIHLDGARIFNAAVYLKCDPKELARDVDSVAFCLSKGLSCPVGSVLCGSKEFIARARRSRKIVGGGMRQAGIIAAAGIVALESMIDRLADDHANARLLAEGMAHMPGLIIDPARVQTNIVFVGVQGGAGAANELQAKLAQVGVKCLHTGGGRLRFVTHYGIEKEDIEEALKTIDQVVGAPAAPPRPVATA